MSKTARQSKDIETEFSELLRRHEIIPKFVRTSLALISLDEDRLTMIEFLKEHPEATQTQISARMADIIIDKQLDPDEYE